MPTSHKRKAWLFCGSELAGQRAAMVMSLVAVAKLSGHEPWAYLRNVLERLPIHPNSRIGELLPHFQLLSGHDPSSRVGSIQDGMTGRPQHLRAEPVAGFFRDCRWRRNPGPAGPLAGLRLPLFMLT
jgi:hypothetical protein